jgi:hypothetical protein
MVVIQRLIMIFLILLVGLGIYQAGDWSRSAEAQPAEPPGQAKKIEKREPRTFVTNRAYKPQEWPELTGQQKAQIARDRKNRVQQLKAQGRKVAKGGGVKPRGKGKGRNK